MSMTIENSTFYKMWEQIPASTDRKNLLKEFTNHQIIYLRSLNKLTDEEIIEAQKLHPRLFKTKEMSQEVLRVSAMNDANYIRQIKDLTSDYINRWILSSVSKPPQPETYSFILKSKQFTEDQKVLSIYTLGYTIAGASRRRKLVSYLYKLAKKSESRRVFLALCAVFNEIPVDDYDELKEAVIQAFDESYKMYKSENNIVVNWGLKVNQCMLNRFSRRPARCLSILPSFETDNIFDEDFGEKHPQYVDNLYTLISEGVYTIDELKCCHLEHLFPTSERIISNL